ncbi:MULTISPECIES: hypothetical protein [Rhizobium/Agrobacterium group]|uniref:Transposase n=1 Tax=Agrobacterium vitis TaxID=373 RepID=A0ABD6HD75_AGRVI|nr:MULTISPECIES: hypothetical protein [Rhizobium/Agrobacterium group]MCF1449741.1 hypothetical protein [Allorhizobium ampelinum]MCF1494715.1 hypothetical protein [Allorhizobium ampelinum]MUO27722.1 hypothetical protein [Agrobacterium vitis]MUO44218.1 hypothetical protein [Agrobacterium vitis]MUP12333.1 hypothetical protein [Agrobacterium vitis]
MEEAIGPKSVKRLIARTIIQKNNPNRKALRLSVGSCRFALAWLPQKKTFNFHWNKNGSFWSVAYLVR